MPSICAWISVRWWFADVWWTAEAELVPSGATLVMLLVSGATVGWINTLRWKRSPMPYWLLYCTSPMWIGNKQSLELCNKDSRRTMHLCSPHEGPLRATMPLGETCDRLFTIAFTWLVLADHPSHAAVLATWSVSWSLLSRAWHLLEATSRFVPRGKALQRMRVDTVLQPHGDQVPQVIKSARGASGATWVWLNVG